MSCARDDCLLAGFGMESERRATHRGAAACNCLLAFSFVASPRLARSIIVAGRFAASIVLSDYVIPRGVKLWVYRFHSQMNHAEAQQSITECKLITEQYHGKDFVNEALAPDVDMEEWTVPDSGRPRRESPPDDTAVARRLCRYFRSLFRLCPYLRQQRRICRFLRNAPRTSETP